MSRWLAFAQKAEEISEPLPASQQEPSKRGSKSRDGDFLLVSAGLLAGVSKEDEREEERSAEPDQDPDPFQKIAISPHGTSIGGRPLTWTGKVVNLAAWRDMTEWEQHGPNGKTFNGKTMKWEGEQ